MSRTNVPTIETGAAQLLLELSDAEASFEKIVRLVEVSPSVAAKLVSIANSAWSNPAVPVTSVSDACARLGLNVVRTTTIALGIGQSFDPEHCPSFDTQRFWSTAILTSNLAGDLAATAGIDTNTARTTALLHNIGLLWLAATMPKETHESLSSAAAEPDLSISECLRKNACRDRRQASLYLYEAWQLPEPFKQGWSTSEHGLAALIRTSESLAAEIYAERPLAESSCPESSGPIATAYEEQLRNLSEIRKLAESLL